MFFREEGSLRAWDGGCGGRKGLESPPGAWKPWPCFPALLKHCPRLACSPSTPVPWLILSMSSEGHWIGNNRLPASPLLQPGTHLVPASHPPRGTQSGREMEGSREQNRSGKAIKKQVSGLEAGKWGAGWSAQEGGERGVEEKARAY